MVFYNLLAVAVCLAAAAIVWSKENGAAAARVGLLHVALILLVNAVVLVAPGVVSALLPLGKRMQTLGPGVAEVLGNMPSLVWSLGLVMAGFVAALGVAKRLR